MNKYQKGVGLVEVMVALILLAIAILGFTALQLRAVSASLEASNNVHAVNLARDMSERMRMNRDGVSVYGSNYERTTSTVDCATKYCTPAEMAQYDFRIVQNKATDLGMNIAIRTCQNAYKLQCIYVSWDETTPTNGIRENDCTNGATYNPKAKCIILEAYRYG